MIDTFDGKYYFLSNFYYSPIKDAFNGMEFPTVEHFFQAKKSYSLEEQRKIAAAPTPGQAKRMGRQVYLREDWEDIKLDIMYGAIIKKFDTHPDIREMLIKTGDEYLEEGNTWHDNYWGNCHCEKCKNIVGQNHLGKLLMQAREIYQEKILNER